MKGSGAIGKGRCSRPVKQKYRGPFGNLRDINNGRNPI